MSQHKSELPVPPAVVTEAEAREVARIWVSPGAQHVSLKVGDWADPGLWGIMLCDLAKHVARAYEQTDGLRRDEVLTRIRELFDAEWAHPTDEPRGQVLGEAPLVERSSL